MLKSIVASGIIAASLSTALPVAQAREVNVWGYSLEVQDDPAPLVRRASPNADFKAQAGERHRLRNHRALADSETR